MMHAQWVWSFTLMHFTSTEFWIIGFIIMTGNFCASWHVRDIRDNVDYKCHSYLLWWRGTSLPLRKGHLFIFYAIKGDHIFYSYLVYGAVSPLSACDGAESWGWLVSSPHPAHWHRSLVTGPGHSIYPTQPRVRAQHTFAHPWKHAKLTYIYYLSLSLYIDPQQSVVHRSLLCQWWGVKVKDSQAEKKLSRLSTKKLKRWKYIQRLFLFGEPCINYSNMEEPCWCYHASEKYTVNWREVLHLFLEIGTKERCLFWSEYLKRVETRELRTTKSTHQMLVNIYKLPPT